MSDQDAAIVTPVVPEPSTAETQMIPRARLNEVLEREREKDRLLKELQDKQTALEQSEALKRGDHEKVIAELRPQAERLAKVEAVINDMLATELAALPEAMASQAQSILALIPSSEDKLKAVRGLQALTPATPAKPTPPPTNAGQGSTGGQQPTLTQAQQTALDRYNYGKPADKRMTAGQYIAFMQS